MAHGKDFKGRNMNDELKKKILIIILIGALILTLDMFLGFRNGGLLISQSKDGLYITRPGETEQPKSITLRAKVISSDGSSYEKSFQVSVDPYEGDDGRSEENTDADEISYMSSQELRAYEVRGMIRGINDDASLKKVTLPSRLSSGERVQWSVERNTHTALIAFMTAVACLFIYRNAYAPLRKERERELESISMQLPGFINRLVLLLNAGLVLNSAFEKSVEESLKLRSGKSDFFYERLDHIYATVKETNGSFMAEFTAFAKESGSNDMLRISNILNDNISKGVGLTEKLQRESESLWIGRKRSCEERCRVAETKLTLPLTIFLLVLVLITVSPALLEL